MEFSDAFSRIWRTHLIVMLLGGFLLLEILSLAVFLGNAPDTGRRSMGENQERVLGGRSETAVPLSEIRGPRIDDEAAAVEVETVEGTTLPTRLFVFLLIAYATLLVFNLAFDFERSVRVQWKFEAVLTALAFFAWYQWDTAEVHPWFPLAVLQTGLLIYAMYLYFFDRKMFRRSLEEERIFVEDQSPTPI